MSPSPMAKQATTFETKPRALIVDDETVVRELMRQSLVRLGFSADTAVDGASALEVLQKEEFDLVLLDVLMPDMDGFAVCRQLRTFSDVPVVMLTALNRTEDIIQGLEAGADNYITKPFSFREVEARLLAVLRRTVHSREGSAFGIASFGDLRLNNTTQQVIIGDQVIDLTPTEFALLRYLATHAGTPVSKKVLREEVWGYFDSTSDNVVELAIHRLRTKIEIDPARPNYLITQRSVGYVLRTEAESSREGS